MITIPEGSSLYYSLLWTDPVARQRFIARLHLVQTLSRTLDDVQEPQVAQSKIHWWHEELQRMVEGTARHPAVQACQDSLAEQRVSPAATTSSAGPGPPGNTHQAMHACLQILTAASTERFTPASTIAELDRLVELDYSARLALLAHSLSDEPQELDLAAHSRTLARGLGRHERLSRLPRMLHRGLPVFSEESYRQYGVKPADLAQQVRVAGWQPIIDAASSSTPEDSSPDSSNQDSSSQDTGQAPRSRSSSTGHRIRHGSRERVGENGDNPGQRLLLSAAIAEAHAELQNALGDAAVREHYRQGALLPLWRLAVLRERQLALWQRSQPDLLRERSTETPLVKLYRAWRHRH
ncbi:MAG: squalene/phytoene synthase family protein [Granulosicoccus sp.]|nr:squalene/phytoene synthase family protein [Granulosicoccus sp.]